MQITVQARVVLWTVLPGVASLLAGWNLSRRVCDHPGWVERAWSQDALKLDSLGDVGGAKVNDEASVAGGGQHSARWECSWGQ